LAEIRRLAEAPQAPPDEKQTFAALQKNGHFGLFVLKNSVFGCDG
jgi:hypothetical protein